MNKMGITYLKKIDYDNNKKLFISNRYDFKEVRTSNRRFMEVGKTKFYISDNPARDMACKLLHHELGMIKNVKDYAISKYMENRYQYRDRVDEKLYVGCCFDQFEDFSSDDVWEIDITSAYPSTALRLGLLSEHNYNKLFETETNTAHISRKMQIKKIYGDTSYFSDGNILKYSKKCRLISLGSLATKKEIDNYENGELKNTELVYDREIANLFYVCAYECGKTMLEISNEVDGVYFWWVDAIFCKEKSKDEVINRLIDKGYRVKAKKLCKINYHSRLHQAVVSKKDKTDMHPYFFSMNVDIEHIKNIIDSEKDAEAMLEWYKQYIDFPELAQQKILDKTKSIYGKNATVEQVIFTDLCNILHIDTPEDLNLKYLMKILNDRGLTYSDFIQIRSITTNVTRSMDMDRIFGYAEERYGADVIALNVCLRAFNPYEEYKSDIEQKEEQNKHVGLSKTTIYKQYKLNRLDNDLDDDDYELNNHLGKYTIIEKTI
jgi:hypothetical protein